MRAQCKGGDSIWITYNHWMSIIEEDGLIIASDCPNRYCCQRANGCDYIDNSEDLCALHRDLMVPLCGKCENGYSELLGTENCGICDRNHYEWLIIPGVLCAAFCVYLLCFDKSSSTSIGMFTY